MLRPPLLSRPFATARTAGAAGPVLWVLLLLGLVLGVVAPPAAQAAEPPADPLAVSIDALDAATLNGKGPIQVSGTLTNLDDTSWSNIHVYPFIGDTPITSESDLAAQVALPDDTVVGQRVIREGHYATIPDVAPGETVAWSFSIPRSALRDEIGSGGSGVYWFGVHALGPTAAGGTPTADGRARTFLPLVAKQKKNATPEKVALVLPIRRRVLHQPDGRISNVAGWVRQLGADGRLSRLVSFASTSTQVSYLLDPAVLDAVRQLAAGNPARNLGPTPGRGSGGSSSSSDASPSDGASTDGSGGVADDDPTDGTTGSGESAAQVALDKEAAGVASAWLDRLKETLPGREVLALPYADPDLPALAVHARSLYASARERAKAVLDGLGIDGVPVVAPPSGYLDSDAIDLLADRPLTLVSDAMVRGRKPSVALVDGHRLALTSAAAASGGPGPGDRWSPVALRQRIAAQAALRLRGHRPVVVMLPDTWTPPGASPGFFAALSALPWLSLTTVEDAVSGESATTVPDDRVVYPHSESAAELPAGVFDSVDDLLAAGRTLQAILSRNTTVATAVLEEGLTSTSYAARRGRGEAADRSWRVIEHALDQISVEVPPSVTLSSNSGRFAVTVANGLDQPVSLHLHAHADDGIAVSGPQTVEVGPGARSTVLLSARATRNGVHTVRLDLTDADGTSVGSGASLPIRSAQVSVVIWSFVGVGCALLFLAIAIRLYRRIRPRVVEEES
ncbi:DUF6049 family protein [Nocardioides sp. DS6]|uniref:DUF6049 family protein n=1 Tax=Nocardioides eburneus TaxID=3231482 RepID=A0ABV3T306_9ACTN